MSELGDTKPIQRHPNFRLFACMNPPNDIGKKELPPGLRNRFTEFYVDELDMREDLMIVVSHYLKDIGRYAPRIGNIVDFYLEARQLAASELAGSFCM